VQELNDWQSRFGDKIDFVNVYIAEAHANDTWPLGKHVDIPSHASFEDRVKASDILINKYGFNKIPVFYDDMDDKFDNLFSVWPERYFIIKDGKFVRIFQPSTSFGFDRKKILEDLEMCYNGLYHPTGPV